MKAIIPTGGRGTRMQPLTFSTNKHFIPIANKPLIFYPIEAIAEAGIKEVLITYNPGWQPAVEAVLGDGSKWNLKFTYVLQEEPKGLANIIEVCEQEINGEEFLLHLGDNIFTEGIKPYVEYFLNEKPNALVTMVKVKRGENTRMGVPYIDKKGQLKEYVEKPKDPPNDYGIPGLYLFDNNVFKCFGGKGKILPSDRGEYEIAAPYNWLVDHNYRVKVLEYKGKWLDPGKFGDWVESNQYLLDNKLEQKVESKADNGSRLVGRLRIGKKCAIKNSEIRGPAAIGDGVTIINSYIGPFTSISEGCVIENSHVENSVLMPNVRISKVKQTINESIIGSGAEIVDANGPTDWMKLFIGEKSVVQI